MPSKEHFELVEMLRGQRDANPATVEGRREQYEMIGGMFPAVDGTQVERVDASGRPAEWLRFEGHGDGVLLYFHGGAYILGSPNTHRGLASRLGKATGLNTLVLDYRLAPEHPFPAPVEDAVAAYRWLIENGTAPESIVIGGDSAGGNLTLATMLALRDAGDPLPRAAFLLSPWTDLAATGASVKARANEDPIIISDELYNYGQNYLNGANPETPLASPLYADLSELPPLLIHVGTAEVLLDDSTRLADRAEAAGVDTTLEVWDEMVHVWHFFAGMLPEADQAIDKIGQFVRSKMAATAARP